VHIHQLLFAILAVIPVWAMPVAAAPVADEYTLKISYRVECPNQDEKSFAGMNGIVGYQGRKIRVDLFKYLNEVEVSLPAREWPRREDVTFYFDDSPDCRLNDLNYRIEAEAPLDRDANLAIRHAPFLVVRKDQRVERQRDLPLGVSYSILPERYGTKKIRYTIFFSNETVHGFGSTTKAASLEHYGRRTDIEWLYDVEFNSAGKVVSRRYQSGFIGGLGHGTRNFKGHFVPGTEHPILFNIAKHNVFGHRGEFTRAGNAVREGYALVPREEIKDNEAREWWQWRRPWIFDVSDRELRRGKGAGEFAAPSDDYLYIQVTNQNQNKSSESVEFQTENALVRSGILKKLGEGLWGKQSFTALRFDETIFHRGGVLSMEGLRLRLLRHDRSIQFAPLRFYRLQRDPDQGYRLLDITHRFHCDFMMICQF
jgi:hypothetical protein